MSYSVRPHRRQPTRLPHPWNSLGKNTGVGCHFLLQCMKVKSESEVAQSCPTQWPHGLQPTKAPPFMGFSRQEYWSGVPLPYSLDPIIHSHIYIFCLPTTAIRYQIHKESGIIRQKENLIWASKDCPWVLCKKKDTQELHSPSTVRGT